MKQGQFPEIIRLGDLNGLNVFKIEGETQGSGCYRRCSARDLKRSCGS